MWFSLLSFLVFNALETSASESDRKGLVLLLIERKNHNPLKKFVVFKLAFKETTQPAKKETTNLPKYDLATQMIMKKPMEHLQGENDNDQTLGPFESYLVYHQVSGKRLRIIKTYLIYNVLTNDGRHTTFFRHQAPANAFIEIFFLFVSQSVFFLKNQ